MSHQSKFDPDTHARRFRSWSIKCNIFIKYTLNEITCDKYLYFYSSRQNGVPYVNRKLAYPKSKLHFFKTLQGQKISCRRQLNITSKQIIRKNVKDLNYYELLQVVYYTVYYTVTTGQVILG